MFAFVVEKDEGEWDMYHKWVDSVWLHTQPQDMEKLLEQYRFRVNNHKDSISIILKQWKLRKTKANIEKAKEVCDLAFPFISFEDFMKEKGFLKAEFASEIVD